MLGKIATISSVVVIIAYLYYKLYFYHVPSPVVTVKNGKLQGIVSLSRDGKEYYEYLGIPFAKPPVGPRLRFESPVPAESWEGIRDSSYFRSDCLQFDSFIMGFSFGSEDCLYLNVYIPKNGFNKSLPVMFYIHGGLFSVGTTKYAGPKNFMDEDVIMVSTSYRLGALGFLNTGDGIIRGNMGLKDQNLALRWVKENIEFFGGDPNKVTIFGESAGGASVHFHYVSPKSKGLFWRAIHQSGSSLSYWASHRNVKEQAITFARRLKCPTDDSNQMVHCLKNLDGLTLANGHIDMLDFFRQKIHTFVPSIEVIKDEDAFLTEEPLETLKNGRFNKVPVISGINTHEGLLISSKMIFNHSKLNEASETWETWAPKILHYPNQLKDVTAKLRKFYFGEGTKAINTTDFIQNFTNLIGDRYFNYPITKIAQLESEHVSSYLYNYDHEGGFSIAVMMGSLEGPLPPVFNFISTAVKNLVKTNILGQTVSHLGTSHGDELGSLFSGRLQLLSPRLPNDDEVSKDFVKLWADFAKDINPLKFRGIQWPKVTKNSVKYLRISNDPAIIEDPLKERVDFWESLNIPNE